MGNKNVKVDCKIVCIDDTKQKILKSGNTYTVLELDRHNRVFIEEHKRFSFLIKRFEVLKLQTLKNLS